MEGENTVLSNGEASTASVASALAREKRVRECRDRRGEVDDGVHAAQRVAEGGRVREVAERDLHPYALVAEPARVAHEAAHRLAPGDQPPQKRGAHRAGGAREQDHEPL